VLQAGPRLPAVADTVLGMSMYQEGSEAGRLEQLWQGDFGSAYTERNASAGGTRSEFWRAVLDELRPRRVLEVGCNVGANLAHISGPVPPRDVWGVDLNEPALEGLRARLPGINASWSTARALPFRDGWFDLVFTVAVLIHQPEETLALAMSELVRCSRRHVLCIEYTAAANEEVAYRGQKGAFFKRPYGVQMGRLFPELRLVREGSVSRSDGFDDGLGLWLFERV